MKKKRIIIAVVCLILAVLMVGSLFVAAGIAFSRIEDFQFGGLVGELLAGKDEIISGDSTTDTERESIDEPYTEQTLQEDTDWYVPPDPGGTPTLRFFLGSCGAWIGNNQIQEFFETGKASEWDHRAVIEDYNAKYVHVWGWAAIFKETPLQLGYKIDDEPSVYGENVEIYEADQSSVTAALGMGALTANSMRIEIPVDKLSGTHTVQILVRNQGGDNEGVICTFEIEKPINPNAPVFLADATYLLQALRTQRSVGVTSYSYTPPPPLYLEEGDFVSLTTTADHGYLTILPEDDLVESTGARYLAIKYRRWFLDSIALYLSSTEPYGEPYKLPCTKNDWQFVIIDLEEQDYINNAYDLACLRFDFFAPNDNREYSFEIAYVATFDSIEAAQAYDAEHPYAKG
ncbi:MAG: hypothetical protein IIW17_07615 [Clostridia bacterium]|nr:hypothetical protein [Clostridia bacterium]MBQ5793871.1 hypothetical protein [Clostridia bacterium]